MMSHGQDRAPSERGLKRQRRRRGCEREMRRSVVAFAYWARKHGLTRREIAARLGVPGRTLVRWEGQWRRNRMILRARGRPVERADPDLRRAVLAVFGLMGPQVGLPTLRHLFPEVPRAELIDLQRRYRRLFRRRKRWAVHVLRWTRAGSVWAMDFADPPGPVDGLYEKLFCVRDLGSDKQLLGLPSPGKSTHLTTQTLTALVRWLGPPLVIKCDNDGVFTAGELKTRAEEHQVLLLFSSERIPAYNGAIEAGIGSLKTRAHYESARHDRPGEWTCDDVEAAVQQANETARPRGWLGPTPNQAWHDRVPLRDDEREEFLATYRRHYTRESAARGVPWGVQLQHREKASIDRVAISRSLVDHGYLLIRRRRITPPFSRSRVDII